ncbi:beta-1,4-galactosyltransferase 3-like isoform 1-T3 [Syngnathus typhle]
MECHRRLGKWPSGLASLVGLTAAVTLVLRCAFWAAPRPLAGCRAESPLLVGPRPVNLSSTPPTLEEIGKRSASVLPGGLYHPPDCEAQHRVAVVVPYRKRAMHLRALLCHLHPFLQRQQIHYRIYVVEQWGDGTFNKGKLLNAGIREVLRDEDWSCIVIHDVDLLAENDRNLYTCDKCNPTHLAVAIDKFHYRCIPPGSLSMSGRTYATFPRCVGVIQLSWRTPQAIGLGPQVTTGPCPRRRLPYRQYFGGVVAVTPDQYRKMNGFSNQYWGWGKEDDDLWQRVALAGMKVMRPPLAIARYKMIKHHRDRGNEENPYNFVLRNRTALAWYVDGLNSLTYKLLSKEQEPLYTRLAINVGEKPRPWVQEETTPDKTATSPD